MKMTFRTILIGSLIVFFAVVSVVVFAPGIHMEPTPNDHRAYLHRYGSQWT